MADFALIKPEGFGADEIFAYRQEMLDNGDSLDGCGPLRGADTPEAYVRACFAFENEDTCPAGYVPATQFFACVDRRIVGMINLRHHIDHPILSVWGGHIGYSVRPTERGKGYATEMLRRVLEVARARGLAKVLVTCVADNAASEHVILHNGGVYDHTVMTENGPIKRFFISLF